MDLSNQLIQALPCWLLALDLLGALRGIDKLAATDLLAELDDICRFESLQQLMTYLGLVPSERFGGSRGPSGRLCSRVMRLKDNLTSSKNRKASISAIRDV